MNTQMATGSNLHLHEVRAPNSIWGRSLEVEGRLQEEYVLPFKSIQSSVTAEFCAAQVITDNLCPYIVSSFLVETPHIIYDAFSRSKPTLQCPTESA